MCNCADVISAKLKTDNTRLVLTLTRHGNAPAEYPTIKTELINRKRGAQAATVMPSFCPFCGEAYRSA